MSLTSISASTSLGYQSQYQPQYQSKDSTLIKESSIAEQDLPLTPEQQNKLQKNAEDQLAAQVDSIKSNYQAAKDYDLMQSYYQQQQKVLDVYMQSATGNESTTNNNGTDIGAVNSLTEIYSAIHTMHQNINEAKQPLPSIPETMPSTDSEVFPVNENTVSTKKQTDIYNSLMTPSNSSYLHLSA